MFKGFGEDETQFGKMGKTVLSGCWVNGDSPYFLCVYLNPLSATTITTRKKSNSELAASSLGFGQGLCL